MTKMTYDGAGRAVTTYTTDGGAVGNDGSILTDWADAGTVNNDIVLTQTSTDYDADGNAIETVNAERNHSASGTGALFTITSIDSSTTNTGSFVISTTASSASSRIYYASNYYDKADRLVGLVNVGDAGGSSYERPSVAATASSSTLLLTVQHYNNAGELDIVTDPKDIMTDTLYDLLGNTLFSVAAWDGSYNPSTGALPASATANQTTAYGYDGDGHMTSETAVMPSGQSSQTTQYVYGGFTTGLISNDLLRMVEYPNASTGAASSSSGYTVVYSYDNLGEVLTMTDRNGNSHTYGYDALGRQVSDAASTKPSGSSIGDFTGLTSSQFDEGSDTWTYSGAAGSTTDPGTSSPIGYLESGSSLSSSVSQTFSTAAGTYVVSFDAAIRSGDTQGVNVTLDGNDLGTFYPQYVLDSDSLGGNTIGLAGHMTGTISLGTGDHTLTLTATNVSGDNIAYVSNVNLLQATSALDGDDPNFTGGGPWSAEGDASVGSGASFVDGTDPFGTSISGDVHLDPGTYILGFQGVKTGGNQGVIVSVDGNLIGAGEPMGYSPNLGTDVFTITESGTYTLAFTPMESDGGTEDEVFLSGLELFNVTGAGTVNLGTIIAAQHILTSYNSQGLVDSITSYDAASGGNAINQVKYLYNGFGQPVAEYQQHAGMVDTSSSLATTYTYNTTNTATFGSRMTVETYPDGTAIDYNYTVSGTASLDSVISRLDSISEGTVTLESYKYLGLSTVVEEDHPQDGVNLTYIASSAGGDGGDIYQGLDRFGRIINQNWVKGTSSVDQVIYHYDANSNVTEEDYPLAIVTPASHTA